MRVVTNGDRKLLPTTILQLENWPWTSSLKVPTCWRNHHSFLEVLLLNLMTSYSTRVSGWIRKGIGTCMYQRNFHLPFLQRISYPLMMSWTITWGHDSVPSEKFSNCGPFMDGLAKSAIGLLPRRVIKDLTIGENSQHTDTFINLFMESRGQFLA